MIMIMIVMDECKVVGLLGVLLVIQSMPGQAELRRCVARTLYRSVMSLCLVQSEGDSGAGTCIDRYQLQGLISCCQLAISKRAVSAAWKKN